MKKIYNRNAIVKIDIGDEHQNDFYQWYPERKSWWRVLPEGFYNSNDQLMKTVPKDCFIKGKILMYKSWIRIYYQGNVTRDICFDTDIKRDQYIKKNFTEHYWEFV